MTDSYSEVEINEALVDKLLIEQFPEWAGLPLTPVLSAGTDNAIYRLGKNMALRLPRFPRVADHIEKEGRWLPILAPQLPLTIPTPLSKGTPGEGYPWNWAIYQWLEGATATRERITDLHQTATEIGQFIAALQKIDPANGPLYGDQNGGRGEPLAMRDQATRNAITALSNLFDADVMTAVWDAALNAPVWHGSPVWLHGDLHEGNLLANQGKLSAVIDFGLLGLGDPACDLMVGWTLLSRETRTAFRNAVSVDDATWERGRGWALSFGVVALAYYQHTNLGLSKIAKKTIEEVLSDQ